MNSFVVSLHLLIAFLQCTALGRLPSVDVIFNLSVKDSHKFFDLQNFFLCHIKIKHISNRNQGRCSPESDLLPDATKSFLKTTGYKRARGESADMVYRSCWLREVPRWKLLNPRSQNKELNKESKCDTHDGALEGIVASKMRLRRQNLPDTS